MSSPGPLGHHPPTPVRASSEVAGSGHGVGRALLVSQTDPWGPTSGARIRQRIVVEAIAERNVVDLVVLSHAAPTLTEESRRGIVRCVHLEIPHRAPTAGDHLRWLVRAQEPLQLLGRNHTEVREHLRDWLRGPYSLVWVTRSSTFAALEPVLPPAPTVVDIDDLEGAKLRTHLQATRTGRRTPLERLRRAKALRDVHAWTRLERRIASTVDAALVCSEHDRKQLATPTARVLPNGYPGPTAPLGRARPSRPPTITIQGELTYAPNADAAGWFVHHVLPHVVRELPDTRVRLVGQSDERVASLHRPPSVTVTGFVDDIGAELAQADLIAVPVRFGGGTRIKVLEAWAHGIPVVSTPAGAEGLGGRDGEHLLLAEQPQQLATQCVRALTDETLRGHLIDNARARFLRRYQHTAVIEEVTGLIDTLMTNG